MAWDIKSRNNRNVVRLMRQIELSEQEFKEFGVKRIRHKTYEDVLYELRWWDLPVRSYFNRRNWKHYRLNQYKE